MKKIYQNSYINSYYNQGNTAVKITPARIPQNATKQKVEVSNLKQQRCSTNYKYMLFVILSLIAVFISCISCIQNQANLTSSIRKVNQLENELHLLVEENNTQERYIENKRNLLEIRDIAMNKLGMVYPSKGQVYLYDGGNSNYVTKY